MWQPSFTIQELEFFTSLKTEVTILPNFSLKEEIFLLRGKVGPFKAGLETFVPLWLALHLKAADKCKIYQPFWFQEGYLNSLSEREKNSKTELISLQNDEFFEISYIFISKATDDIKKIHHTRALIEGIENMRREKIRRLFEENHGNLKLKNLTTYEANRIRDPLSKLGLMVDRLKKSDLERNRKQ